jgi:tetratricopeptide (TPR) repeat protein
LNPHDSYAWQARGGRAYYPLRRYAEALADLNHADELGAGVSRGLSWRAVIYQALGETDKAQVDLCATRDDVRQRYERNPQNMMAVAFLLAACLACGEVEQAEPLCRALLSGRASVYAVGMAITVIDLYAPLIADRARAQAIRDRLQQRLDQLVAADRATIAPAPDKKPDYEI